MAGTLALDSDISTLYSDAICVQGMASTSEELCSSTPGCLWNNPTNNPLVGSCVKDVENTGLSQRFGELMCFGDGSGPELTGAKITERSSDLRTFFTKDHIQPYLSFYFDKGFAENPTPQLKYTRGFMSFGGPIAGFSDPGELYEVQENALIDWFQEYVRPEFRKNMESDEPNETTGGQVEIT